MEDGCAKFKDAAFEDLVQNPNKFGLPTFEEFKNNREKWLGKRDDSFDQVDKGSKNLSRMVKKQKYEIAGRKCKSLEEVERVAHCELGIDIDKLDYRPELIPQGGGTCDVLVKFVSKEERERRKDW